MNKKIHGFILLTILGLLVTSCTHPNTSDLDKLEGRKWDLQNIHKSVPITGSVITIEFNNGEVHGSSGCNSYFGEYEIKGNEISFGMLGSTEMACLDPEGLMNQEQDYLSILSEVVSFSIEDSQLILKKAVQDQLTYIGSQ